MRVYDTSITDPTLPRVVYFAQVSGSTLYGERLEGRLPGLMHPNEILDGALLNDRSNSHASHRAVTYFNQNHAVIEELYARHDRDLSLVGVILYPAAADDIAQKEKLAEWAVKLARLVGAQGACSSYAGGGHPCVEFMLICQKCERAGIRTVQLMPGDLRHAGGSGVRLLRPRSGRHRQRRPQHAAGAAPGPAAGHRRERVLRPA